MIGLPEPLETEFNNIFAQPAGRIQQHPWELRLFLRHLVDSLRPQRTLELGSWRGTSALLLSFVTTSPVLSLDIQDYGGKDEALAIARRHHRDLQFQTLDARLPNTVAAVAKFFGGPVDLLFLDDGHRIEEVTDEYHLWKPLVRPGGWIVFHDINPDANQCAPGVHPDICQAHVFWAGLTGNKEEIVFRGTPPGPGIGILKL